MKRIMSLLISQNYFRFSGSIILMMLVFTVSLQAQDIRSSRKTSYYTFIYRISEREAGKIYRNDLWKVGESFFHTKIDSFPTDSTYRKKLPFGHYLYVRAEEKNLHVELKSRGNVDVKIVNNNTDLVLYLTDTTGSIIPDALVTIGGRRLRFDSLTHSYLLKKSNNHGFLSINYLGIHSFFYITRQYKSSRFKRAANCVLYRSPVKYVAIPVTMVVLFPKSVYDLAVHQRRTSLIYCLTQPFYDIGLSVYYRSGHGWIRKLHNCFTAR